MDGAGPWKNTHDATTLRPMRRAKIVCTLGPASATKEIIERLVRAGLDVARLNFSHGTHEDHKRTFDLVREVAETTGRAIAILQDLQGPKIRVRRMEGGRVDLVELRRLRPELRAGFDRDALRVF